MPFYKLRHHGFLLQRIEAPAVARTQILRS